jgi:hypothetical protein
MFDLIHAPFTRPLGTQIALVIASNSWDAYCLFIESVIKECGLEGETSNQMLEQAHLVPQDQEVADSANHWLQDDLQCQGDEIPSVIDAGKHLRNSFVHHGGDPTEKLRKLVGRRAFSQKLMRFLPDGKFEVVIPMASKIHQVLVSKVELIQAKADRLFP